MRAPDPTLKMNETRAREKWNRTDLGTNHVGELEGLVLGALEVVGDRHALALVHGERQLVGGRRCSVS
jgi:hypothetical protein